MLTASYKSRYRRADDLGFRYMYVVKGTPEELEEYKKTQGAFLTIDEESGFPMYRLTEWRIVPGQRPQRNVIRPHFTLQFNRNRDGVFIDTTSEDMRLHAAVNDVDKLAEAIRSKMAEQWIGGNAAPVTAAAPKKEVATNTNVDPNKVLEDLKKDLEGGNEGGNNEPPAIDTPVETPVTNAAGGVGAV